MDLVAVVVDQDVGGVEADGEVEVDEAAALELGDLDVLHPHQRPQPLHRHAGERGEAAVDADAGPPPQLGGMGVPQHRGLVVEALLTERLAEQRVAGLVAGGAAGRAAVGAGGVVGAAATAVGPSVAAKPGGVDRPKGGGGEGDEQRRVLRDGVGHVLAATEAGDDELERVALVQPRAGPAAGRAPVTARHEDGAVGQVFAAPGAADLSGGGVGEVGAADEADGAFAAADPADLGLHRVGQLAPRDHISDRP